MRVAPGAGPQTSTCIGHDARAAWALDSEGQQLGPAVTLDAVFGADQSEAGLYPEVIDHLVSDFVRAPRGVACLLCYGPADVGKAGLLYGDAGSPTNFTPRGLPPPGHRPQQRAAGLVVRAIHTCLSQLQGLSQAYPSGSTPDGTRVPQAGQLQMACVMLHVELLRDLLSPQSPVRLSESAAEGVQLQGAHWQSVGDVKEAEGLLQLAAQNRAEHTLQADNGFLDACHVLTVVRA